MMALVSSDEMAKDVTGAEALLERHQVSCILGIPRLLGTPAYWETRLLGPPAYWDSWLMGSLAYWDNPLIGRLGYWDTW